MSTIFLFQTKWIFLLYIVYIFNSGWILHFLTGRRVGHIVHSYIFKVRSQTVTTYYKIVSKCLLGPKPTLFFAVQMTFWFWKTYSCQCDSTTFISTANLRLPVLNTFISITILTVTTFCHFYELSVIGKNSQH
jgi:hypothetical protein